MKIRLMRSQHKKSWRFPRLPMPVPLLSAGSLELFLLRGRLLRHRLRFVAIELQYRGAAAATPSIVFARIIDGFVVDVAAGPRNSRSATGQRIIQRRRAAVLVSLEGQTKRASRFDVSEGKSSDVACKIG